MTTSCKICGSSTVSAYGHFDESILYLCHNCSVVFRLDEKEIEYFEENERSTEVWKEYERLYYKGRSITYSKILDQTGNGKNKKLLDVGSAMGWFMEMAASKGYSTWGIEPSKYVAPLGKARTNRPVDIAMVENIPHPNNYFDVVSLFDVLEHTVDPEISLIEVKRVLNDDGILVLRVPDTDGLLPMFSYFLYRVSIRNYLNPLRLLYRFHLWGFNKKSLHFLLNRVGFEILSEYGEDAQELSAIRGKVWARNWVIVNVVIAIIYLGRLFKRQDEIVIIAKKRSNIL